MEGESEREREWVTSCTYVSLHTYQAVIAQPPHDSPRPLSHSALNSGVKVTEGDALSGALDVRGRLWIVDSKQFLMSNEHGCGWICT